MREKGPAGEPDGARSGRRRRLARYGIAVAIITAVLVIGLWGMFGVEDYPDVGDVLDDRKANDGRELSVKGTVKEGSLDRGNGTFTLTDGASELFVECAGALPAELEEGKEVVVTGTFHSEGPALTNAKLKSGCSSKY